MTGGIIGSYWTVAGPVDIRSGRQWSMFSWADRCAEAARTGLRGLGLWHADLAHLRERLSFAEIRSVFDDHGLAELELEFLSDWFLDPGTPGRAASDEARDLLFDAAAQLGARHIKVGNLFGNPCPLSQVTDRFAELCADAAGRHGALLAYEFMPFDPNVNSVATAARVAEGAAAANGGLAADFWHLGKLGITPGELRGIPPRYLAYVELSDGMRADMPDLGEETTRYRRLPGEGEFDVRGYLSVLRDLGYGGPWGVEVLSDALRALPMAEMFDAAAASASAVLSAPETTR
jgi:sugar phosphate isomerase/epimerase